MKKEATKCKVKVLRPLPGVYASYQPKVGKVYEAVCEFAKTYTNGRRLSPVCVIKIRDKSICLRTGEYEILED